MNESLTPIRSSILYALRQLKKINVGKIDYCGSRDGKVFMWLKPTNNTARNRKVYVNNIDTLTKLCTNEFNADPAEFLRRTEQH